LFWTETERETEEIEKLSPKRNADKGNEGKERCYIGKVGASVGGVSDLLHPFPCLLIANVQEEANWSSCLGVF
jgi:hypothetical protein